MRGPVAFANRELSNWRAISRKTAASTVAEASGGVGGTRLAPVLPRSRTEDYLMSLINLIVTLVVVGVLLWLVNNYIPMEARIKKILNVVVIIVVILWLLNAFGIIGPIAGIHIGR
jgi:hypothetical protein